MNKIVKKIQFDFNDVPDLDIKEINISIFKKIYVLFLETICSSSSINDFILKNLTNKNYKNLPGPNTITIDNYDDIDYYLTNGFAIIINNNKVFAIEVKGELTRSISPSTREQTLFGPEDALVENYQTNLGLIKRRIKTKALKTKELTIGNITKTKVGINYIENIANSNYVNNIIERLTNIETDGILDVEKIINYIEIENKSVFPLIRRTERPDVISDALLDGKVIILVDTTPFAIILPTFLVDYINPISDNYSKSLNVFFLKMLRLLSFILSMVMPAIFIANVNYNQETIPTSLLINFSMQRSSVPFPAIIELLIMLIICDILRESDLRFPSSFGSTISILGALIIGDAAVSAGIVSPIMIIITALTFISGLMFTDIEINNALRFYRYLFLFVASILGLYGIFITSMFFFTNLIKIQLLDKPYFAPIMPFDKSYFFKTLLKKQDRNDTERSKLITNNITRGNI